MGPVCTIMVGRLDDWLKVVADKAGHHASIPAISSGRAWRRSSTRIASTEQRGYRLRLLSAAFRNHMHWSEFIGGDVVISPPHAWQKRFNSSDVQVKSANRHAGRSAHRRGASATSSRDFRRAYEPDGLTPAEFDSFGPTVRTLRQFSDACHDLERSCETSSLRIRTRDAEARCEST